MSLTLSLSAAVLCTATHCWPVLVGKTTPLGEFTLQQRLTADPGYGGDVLQFSENDEMVFAIHRVWTLRPKEKRLERLRSQNPKDRIITKGCVNVDTSTYEILVSHYRNRTLRIVP